MLCSKDFYEKHGSALGLKLIAGEKGLKRQVKKPFITRPGLALSGFMKWFTSDALFVFGRTEIGYLNALPKKVRIERLNKILEEAPAVIIARNHVPPKEIIDICKTKNIPLFRTKMKTMMLISKITLMLMEEFSPSMTLHGTLVEVFGIGVLIQGDSSIGKSETALGLLERGHRLISDDIVKVKKKESALLGSGPDLIRHLMEIRGIGIINVANLYGAVCVRPDKELDIIVKLEEWDDRHFYDRVGLEEKFQDILGINIPLHILPVKPGRDVVLLIETIALNHRLKGMGYNSAKEFNTKLLEAISLKQKRKQILKEASVNRRKM